MNFETYRKRGRHWQYLSPFVVGTYREPRHLSNSV
jgi:hypothetical protein